MMNNPVGVLLRAAALAGGAVLGALLSRWFDDWLSKQSKERSDYDKMRYEQGLGPVAAPPKMEEGQE